MAKPKSLPWPPYLCSMLLLLILAVVKSLSGAEPMPNSSRECAICHIRWVDALVRNDPRADIMETVLERQAGSGDMCLSCHTDKAPETKPAAGAPVHRIGHTYPGFEPPATLLDERATFGSNGELGCLSCHRLHDASGAKPLLIRKNEDSSLCLECHKKERAVIESRHDLRLSSPETVNASGEKPSVSGPCGSCHRIHGWARDVPETNRPHSSGCMECHNVGGPGSYNRPYEDAHAVGTTLSQGMSTTLPLDSATGDIGCMTCHDPHAAPLTPEARRKPSPSRRHMFLRPTEHQGLCADCHGMETLWRFLYYHKERRNPYSERNVNPLSPRKE